MCAAQAAPPGPPPPGPGHVWRARPQPGGHLHKGRAAGPAPGPRAAPAAVPACAARERPVPAGAGGRKKGRNDGRAAGGGRCRRRHHLRLLLLLLSAPRPQPSGAQPSGARAPGTCRWRCGWHLPPSVPQRRQRPGPARPRAPTSLAHPPRGGRDGMGGGGGVLARSAESLRGNFQMRGTRPWALTAAASWTTDPGMPRGNRFRSRPGGCCLSRGTPGIVVPGPSGKGRSRYLPRLHLVGTALLPCPA